MDTFGTHFVERLSSFGGYFAWSMYTRILLVCPLFGGLSSFGVSFIRGFTVVLGTIDVIPMCPLFRSSIVTLHMAPL